MNHRIAEIQIVPIKPATGLVAFASCVLNDELYIGSIGVLTRPTGGYRLVYPTKNVGSRSINIFHPINKPFAEFLEAAILNNFEEVMNKSDDRYCSNYPQTK